MGFRVQGLGFGVWGLGVQAKSYDWWRFFQVAFAPLGAELWGEDDSEGERGAAGDAGDGGEGTEDEEEEREDDEDEGAGGDEESGDEEGGEEWEMDEDEDEDVPSSELEGREGREMEMALGSYDGADSCPINVIQPVGAGQEIHNTYGEKPNCQLLLAYGFAVQDNVFDQVFALQPVPPPRVSLEGVSGAPTIEHWCTC